MTDQLCRTAGRKICQDRYYYGLISVYGKEENTPAGRVFCADCNFVSGLYAGCLEENVVTLYKLRYL